MSATPIFDEVLRARTLRLAPSHRDAADSPADRTAASAAPHRPRHRARPPLYVVTGDGAHGAAEPSRYAGRDSSPA